MDSKKYILAIDQSTAGTKAVIFDRRGELIYKCSREHQQYYPKQGWVEHDAEEPLFHTRMLIANALKESEIGAEELACIALTNQRETALIWDKYTGKPVYRAIVWQCNRGTEICARLTAEPEVPEKIKRITGLPLSEYFSAAKLAWIVENVEGVKELMSQNKLLCGTIDSWLVWNLSAEKAHVTDYTNASRTQLFDLEKKTWNDWLINKFGLKVSMFPKIVSSDDIVGHMLLDNILVPIAGLVGDSQGALFAQTGLGEGIKVTYGTGSSIMYKIGNQPCYSDNLAVSVACACLGEICYGLEGNVNSTGATLKWLVEKARFTKNVEDIEKLAAAVQDNGGVYLVPAFSGLGAPYWSGNAKAVLYGMNFGTTKEHIARAAIESIAYQIHDVIDCMEKETGVSAVRIRADGKPTENQFLMQFQADVLGKTVTVSKVQEASAFGAALLAGLAVGFWNKEEISGLIKDSVSYFPLEKWEKVKNYCQEWKQSVQASIGK